MRKAAHFGSWSQEDTSFHNRLIYAAVGVSCSLSGVVAPSIPDEHVSLLYAGLAKSGRTHDPLRHRFEHVLRHHYQSKHFFDVQAELPAKYMDWDAQPSPWRTYVGAPTVNLPHEIFDDASVSLTVGSLGSFMRLACGISAWKSYDGIHKWALRVAPSSGNLQTTEIYVALPGLGKPLADNPAVYHYQPEWHTLELRAPCPQELITTATGSGIGFLVIFTTLCVREAWKYGERALRSCHLNLGHAIGAVRTSARLHGWTIEAGPLPLRFSETLSAFLGAAPRPLRGTSAEEEVAELALLVRTNGDSNHRPIGDLVSASDLLRVYESSQQQFGTASPLTPLGANAHYQRWESMDAAQASSAQLLDDEKFLRPRSTSIGGPSIGGHLAAAFELSERGAAEVILQRRSVLKMAKGSHTFPRRAWLAMLHAACESTVPSAMSRSVHLFIMVHDVEGIPPGFYIFLRNHNDTEALRGFMRHSPFQNWQDVTIEDGQSNEATRCSLWAISAPTDVRQASQLSACNQEIAGEGAFAVAMIGRFDGWYHPHEYLELLWEAGALGQVLYLVSTAIGFGATGIGCFFDDFVLSFLRDTQGNDAGNSGTQTFQPDDAKFQALYHFAVGLADVDPRLLSFDPYHHLQEEYSYEPLQGGLSRIRRKI